MHGSTALRVPRWLALLACLLVAPSAWPAPPLVFAFNELAPWKTREGAGYGGAYTEIARELARRMRLELRIVPCPLERCLLLMQHGQADMMIGIQNSPQRLQHIHFLRTPYRQHSSDKVFYIAKDRSVTIQRYQDLAGLAIGVKHGTNYFAQFDGDSTLRKDVAYELQSSFQKLMLGRLDAVISAEDQAEPVLSQLNLRGRIGKAAYRVSDPGARSVGIALASTHASRIADFERAMAAMAQDGTLKALYQRHYYEAWNIPPASVPIE